MLLPHETVRWKKLFFFFVVVIVVPEGDFGVVGFEMVLAHL